MLNNANEPTNCGGLDFARQQFLKSKGFAQDKSIVDCDPMQQTVTFNDGRVRTATDIYSRCMGYHRPVEYWNAGKQQEHRDRKLFRESRVQFLEGAGHD